jgi:periplasmic protein TonB
LAESWRDQLQQYRDRWLIGLAAALSLLFHVAVIVVMFSGWIDFRPQAAPSDTIDFDLQDMAALEDALRAAGQDPERMLYQRQQANQNRPDKADALSYEDHDAGKPSHLADQPINEFDRAAGPRGPGIGPQPSRRPSPSSRSLPPIPDVGQGVGEPRGSGAETLRDQNTPPGRQAPSENIDQMLARTSGKAVSGGGEDGVSAYNPNVGAPGSAMSISTQKLRYMGYFSHMREKIYLAWTYPQAAQRSGQQGVTFLSFTIAKSGQVTEARVLQSSGYRLLDQYALKAVSEAGFNPMPNHWPEKDMTISASFHYRLVGARAIQ